MPKRDCWKNYVVSVGRRAALCRRRRALCRGSVATMACCFGGRKRRARYQHGPLWRLISGPLPREFAPFSFTGVWAAQVQIGTRVSYADGGFSSRELFQFSLRSGSSKLLVLSAVYTLTESDNLTLS